jgi:hypothetical protein
VNIYTSKNETIKNEINTFHPIFYTTYNEFKEEHPIITNSVPIYIFYHICTVNMKIVDEQIGELVNSGLYATATKLFYGCNCSSCDTILEEYMKQYDKFVAIPSAILPDVKTYENGTINAMINYAKETNEKFYALYIHTKGSSNRSEAQQNWRRFMMYWLVVNHKLCIDILNRSFYTVGLFYSSSLGLSDKHYAGNFYWADSSYLKILNQIPTEKMKNRFNAEMVLFTKHQKNKHICLLRETALCGQLYIYSHHIKLYENPDLAIV